MYSFKLFYYHYLYKGNTELLRSRLRKPLNKSSSGRCSGWGGGGGYVPTHTLTPTLKHCLQQLMHYCGRLLIYPTERVHCSGDIYIWSVAVRECWFGRVICAERCGLHSLARREFLITTLTFYWQATSGENYHSQQELKVSPVGYWNCSLGKIRAKETLIFFKTNYHSYHFLNT